jgi:UDPglucose 6-dehydrogenase
MRAIGKAMSSKKGHLVVLTSTVMPGSMDNDVLPALENSSQLRCRKDFGLCYNPEFIALGDIVHGMLKPDLVLIGESDKKSGKALEQFQRNICTNVPTFARMNFMNAELAKISVNSFVTMKMSFANTLAEICEGIPGGDVDVVTRAVGADKRIGRAYLKGAVGYAGPCFPRDNIAFAVLAKKVGAQALLALTTHKVNERQADRIVEVAQKAGLKKGMKVSVLGLAYKPRTNVVDESQGIAICNVLAGRGFEVHAHDPSTLQNTSGFLRRKVKMHGDPESALAAGDVCIITTPWEDYKRLSPSHFKGKIVVDCWRILPRARASSKKYVQLGANGDGVASRNKLSWA